MMNQFEIKEDISRLLQKIMERSAQIKHDPRASVLDIDLLMDDLRRLYGQYESLRSMVVSRPLQPKQVAEPAEEKPAAPREVKTEEEAPEPDVASSVIPPAAVTPEQEPGQPLAMEREPRAQQPAADQQQPQDADPVNPAAEPAEPAPQHEPLADEQQEPAEPSEKQEATPEREPEKPVEPPKEEASDIPVQKPVTPPVEPIARPAGPRAIIDLFTEPMEQGIGDRLKKEDDSLHQKISQNKGDASISSRMQQSPVANIRSAIGVNDKFLFINELFHGNIQSYNEAIDRLNSFESVQPAFEYLNELAQSYSWDSKRSAETIEKLANLVQRRYM